MTDKDEFRPMEATGIKDTAVLTKSVYKIHLLGLGPIQGHYESQEQHQILSGKRESSKIPLSSSRRAQTEHHGIRDYNRD